MRRRRQAESRVPSLDQSLGEAALAAQAVLGPPHAASVALVIVTEQVQQPVERQDPELGALGMPHGSCLSARDTAGDYDVS